MRRALFVVALLLVSCTERTNGYALVGNARRGPAAIEKYGCDSCHVIPRAEQRGLNGPSLERIAGRAYLAGRFPNVPQNMILWIRTPQHLKPHSGMPDLGVTERDSRDIAAYLYTLR